MEDQIEKLVEDLKKLKELNKLQEEINSRLEANFSELKVNRKMSQSEVEVENIEELNKKIKSLQAKVNSQDEVLKKIKKLEDESAKLVVDLENLTAEKAELVKKNNELEEQIVVLEGNDKFNHKNITLLTPTILINKELRRLKSLKDVEELKEIHEKSMKAFKTKISNGKMSSPFPETEGQNSQALTAEKFKDKVSFDDTADIAVSNIALYSRNSVVSEENKFTKVI